jgi:hypothetical protein
MAIGRDPLDDLPLSSPPRCVFLVARINFDAMVHAPLVKRLRERHGTRFIVWTVDGDRAKDWQRWIADGDRILVETEQLREASRADPDPEAALARARANERRYCITYMRNVLHQDKGIAARYLQHVPNSAFARRDPGPLIDLVRKINHYIGLAEQIFDSDRADLLLMRRSGVFNSAVHAVAESRRIPSSFVDHTRRGRLLSFAEGPDHGARALRAIADSLPPPALLDLSDIAPPPDTQWFIDRLNRYWSLSALAGRLYRLTRNYAAHIAIDILKRQAAARLPYLGQIRNVVAEYRTARMLDGMTLKSIDDIARRSFVLFTLHFDPEYTSSTLARDFNHTHAVIQQMALSLPSGYRLVVKEHVQGIGSRDETFYRSLACLPNVVFADHRIRAVELAARSEAVATIAGTIATEATLLGKPVILFSPYVPYAYFPGVRVVREISSLPAVVRAALAPRTDAEIREEREASARFRAASEILAFDAPSLDYDDGGNRNRNSANVEIPPESLERAERILRAVIAAQTGSA